MPTYRRIEQGLDVVFPKLQSDIRRYTHDELHGIRQNTRYTEIVRFGMEDVTASINRTLGTLKEESRSQFNSLAASYLRDIVRGNADLFDREEISALSDGDVVALLSRVEEDLLSEADKSTLLEVITRVRSGRRELDIKEKFLAHYFSKIVAVSNSLKKADTDVRAFVDICNKYLKPFKRLVYNDRTYEIVVETEDDNPVEMKDLSSGEKQIVSLFSHILLDSDSRHIVIIDEPELSLSVLWQTELLPDIMSLGRCSMLLAVTHSPFIYENLQSHARDLQLSMHRSL
jgi:molybdopterin converting factor small subunit